MTHNDDAHGLIERLEREAQRLHPAEGRAGERTLQEWVDLLVAARRDGRLSDDELDILLREVRGATGQNMEDAAARCDDCGRPYGDEHGFPDLVIPNYIWKRISPSGDEGGLLCPSCICKALHAAKITGVEGAFMSGSVESVSYPTMQALRMAENLEERLGRMESAQKAKGGE